MDRILRIAAGLLLGVAVGAGLVLLFAPQSGAETRQLAQNRLQSVLAEGRQAAETRRIELTAEFQALKGSSVRNA